jgi:hypothetical protein
MAKHHRAGTRKQRRILWGIKELTPGVNTGRYLPFAFRSSSFVIGLIKVAFGPIHGMLWGIRYPVAYSRHGKSSFDFFIDDLKPGHGERSETQQPSKSDWAQNLALR